MVFVSIHARPEGRAMPTYERLQRHLLAVSIHAYPEAGDILTPKKIKEDQGRSRSLLAPDTDYP